MDRSTAPEPYVQAQLTRRQAEAALEGLRDAAGSRGRRHPIHRAVAILEQALARQEADRRAQLALIDQRTRTPAAHGRAALRDWLVPNAGEHTIRWPATTGAPQAGDPWRCSCGAIGTAGGPGISAGRHRAEPPCWRHPDGYWIHEWPEGAKALDRCRCGRTYLISDLDYPGAGAGVVTGDPTTTKEPTPDA